MATRKRYPGGLVSNNPMWSERAMVAHTRPIISENPTITCRHALTFCFFKFRPFPLRFFQCANGASSTANSPPRRMDILRGCGPSAGERLLRFARCAMGANLWFWRCIQTASLARTVWGLTPRQLRKPARTRRMHRYRCHRAGNFGAAQSLLFFVFRARLSACAVLVGATLGCNPAAFYPANKQMVFSAP